jgi:hypothetical protein
MLKSVLKHFQNFLLGNGKGANGFWANKYKMVIANTEWLE